MQWQEAMWTFSTFSCSSLVQIAGSGKKHLATYKLSLPFRKTWLVASYLPAKTGMVHCLQMKAVSKWPRGHSLPTFAHMAPALFLPWILSRKCPLKFSSVVTDFIAVLPMFERRSTRGFTLHGALLLSSWQSQQYESALLGSLKRRWGILHQ